MRTLTIILLAYAGSIGCAWAQGQDGTPGERNLQIIAELLPGLYDNANQAYFEQRLNYPEDQRHARLQVSIEAVDEPELGDDMFQMHDYLLEAVSFSAPLFAAGDFSRTAIGTSAPIDKRASPMKT